MVTLAPSGTLRVGDSAIENIEVKLTHLKKKKFLHTGGVRFHDIFQCIIEWIELIEKEHGKIDVM